MIKITDKNKTQRYYFPKHLSSNHIDHILEIRSLITKEARTVPFTDKQELWDYYTFEYNKEFEDLEDGEYGYSIDEDKAFGILILGKYYENSKIDIQTIEDDEKIFYYE